MTSIQDTAQTKLTQNKEEDDDIIIIEDDSSIMATDFSNHETQSNETAPIFSVNDYGQINKLPIQIKKVDIFMFISPSLFLYLLVFGF